MKASEVTAETVKEFLKNDCTGEDVTLNAIIAAAKAYILGYTGLPLTSTVDVITGIKPPCVDDYEDMAVALLVLCSDMYDNRQMTVQNDKVNKVVQSILDLHCLNLL